MSKVPLLIVYTGDGKGKTTAALGLMMRSVGHGASCAMIQFIKNDSCMVGERRVATMLHIPWETYGEGFLWKQKDMEPTKRACQAGWERAKQWISSGFYDLIVLDEFTYPLSEGFVDRNAVLSHLHERKNNTSFPHIVITGRHADESLISEADMVHEITSIKHPFKEQHVKAQRLIEF